ncbi:MSMEG_0567/Sll0786 family nitrogen starvation N-acetyltransferase [Aquariibacter albus]|uniref:GNAT family N-acetyltransferase n=1 Tax=Aquariibacter albus TaxID=2759899 RepID=A0A839HJZ4_9BURK|nr:MSMEG_0567/Sll0786 family nitrogen starvation N-acetyltransferase [Aquariibacter albus]MBB1163097.1 GNAT family N-acetyltransferase [Aquariibacter albus]
MSASPAVLPWPAPAALPPWCELPQAFVPAEFRIKRAVLPWELDGAARLRRAVFCAEQGVFVGDDRDALDPIAQTLVAVACWGGQPEQVVGTVRLHQAADADPQQEPGVWWGSRLAVHPAFRSVGRIGATLIRLAVCSAHAQGAHSFFAHVQEANVPLFEKLHWKSLGPRTLHGRPHRFMQADLKAYPPCPRAEAGFVSAAFARRA